MDEKQNEISDCTSFAGTNVGRKRRYYDTGEEEECNDDVSAPKILIEEAPFSLLEFCDEILLEIFKHLDGCSLQTIGLTCHRLYRLSCDHRLWKNIDLTSEELPQKSIRKILKKMHHNTENIAIRGLTKTFPKDTWNNITLGSSLLKCITETCEQLQMLEFYHSFLNFESMGITDFPKNLKRLVFNNCYVRWPKAPHAFFNRIDTHLDRLEELIVEYCNWFETHDLVLFSKIPLLKKLSLRGCMNLKDCVPYGSIATRFGFRKLEHLDVRDTLISDSDIQCFNITYTLKELLLECPDDIRSAENSIERGESPPPRPQRPGNSAENLVQVVINHDRSLFNVRVLQNRQIPNIEVNLDADGAAATNNRTENGERSQSVQQQQQQQQQPQQQQPRQVPDINRAISQSIWFERRYPPPFSPPRVYPISDRGILCFGAPRNFVQGNIVWIRAEPRPADNNLERLTVRHYKLVTDTALAHLAQCSPKLVYLDLTGTAVTRAGIDEFKLKKPDCFVISDHYRG